MLKDVPHLFSIRDNPLFIQEYDDISKEYPEKYKKLKKFLVKICQKENIPIPDLIIIDSKNDLGGAGGLLGYKGYVSIGDNFLKDYKHLKPAKGCLLHELAHLKYYDIIIDKVIFILSFTPILTSLFFCFFNFSFNNIAFLIFTTITMPLLYKYYCFFTEYRADLFCKKYMYHKSFLDELDTFQYENEHYSITHPTMKDRRIKLTL